MSSTRRSHTSRNLTPRKCAQAVVFDAQDHETSERSPLASSISWNLCLLISWVIFSEKQTTPPVEWFDDSSGSWLLTNNLPVPCHQCRLYQYLCSKDKSHLVKLLQHEKAIHDPTLPMFIVERFRVLVRLRDLNSYSHAFIRRAWWSLLGVEYHEKGSKDERHELYDNDGDWKSCMACMDNNNKEGTNSIIRSSAIAQVTHWGRSDRIRAQSTIV